MNKLMAFLLALFLPLRSLKKDTRAMVDLGVVLMVGIAFAAMVVIAYIIFTIRGQLLTEGGAAPGSTEWPWGSTDAINASMNTSYWAENASRATIFNVTTGFDNAVNLLLVAITIFILAIAIAALLMLRGR